MIGNYGEILALQAKLSAVNESILKDIAENINREMYLKSEIEGHQWVMDYRNMYIDLFPQINKKLGIKHTFIPKSCPENMVLLDNIIDYKITLKSDFSKIFQALTAARAHLKTKELDLLEPSKTEQLLHFLPENIKNPIIKNLRLYNYYLSRSVLEL